MVSNPHIELGREQLGEDDEPNPFAEAEQEPGQYEEERPGLPEEQEEQQ